MSTVDQPWRIPPCDPQLGENEVHVWRVFLERKPAEMKRFQDLLVGEEITRARKFYFEKDQRSWIIARAALRMLIGRYLHIDPRSLRFTTNTYGKPSIASPLLEKPLHFNLSHSGDLAVLAFSYGRQLGVDVERIRTGIEYWEIATRHFSARECAALVNYGMRSGSRPV